MFPNLQPYMAAKHGDKIVVEVTEAELRAKLAESGLSESSLSLQISMAKGLNSAMHLDGKWYKLKGEPDVERA